MSFGQYGDAWMGKCYLKLVRASSLCVVRSGHYALPSDLNTEWVTDTSNLDFVEMLGGYLQESKTSHCLSLLLSILEVATWSPQAEGSSLRNLDCFVYQRPLSWHISPGTYYSILFVRTLFAVFWHRHLSSAAFYPSFGWPGVKKRCRCLLNTVSSALRIEHLSRFILSPWLFQAILPVHHHSAAR